jgi:hypothetical protein
MRRIPLVTAVVAVMAAMMMAMAGPGFARSQFHGSAAGPAPESGGDTSGGCTSNQPTGTPRNSAAHTFNPNFDPAHGAAGYGLC